MNSLTVLSVAMLYPTYTSLTGVSTGNRVFVLPTKAGLCNGTTLVWEAVKINKSEHAKPAWWSGAVSGYWAVLARHFSMGLNSTFNHTLSSSGLAVCLSMCLCRWIWAIFVSVGLDPGPAPFPEQLPRASLQPDTVNMDKELRVLSQMDG